MTAWDPAERPDAGECAAVFGRPGPLFQIPVLPEVAATVFGTDDVTSPDAQFPAGLAHPQPTTALGDGPAATPSSRQASLSAMPVGSSTPVVPSALSAAAPVAAVVTDPETKAKDKRNSRDSGDGTGGNTGHRQGRR